MAYTFRMVKGPEPEKPIAFSGGSLTFGSAAPADVIFDAPEVAPQHARITIQGGQPVLEDLGSGSGTFRNGQQLLAPLQLFSGDEIGLGPNVVLRLEGGEEPAAAEEEAVGLDAGLAEV